ncbi:MAG: hypothetical protein NC319_04810 [Butyricicoccus sp.]|nr:hypothetical protein [Butyricicoccus sp.]MCM1236216.1 hypothetical protein [Ruminococcus flavefaciens]
MEFVLAGLLVYVIIIIVFDWFAAKAMYEIAVMKGYPQKKYFWWCFGMAIFGYPMVIALPDRRGAQAQNAPSIDKTQNAPSIDELPDL